ncbi:MAG: hypothetical protein HY079_05060 [Elusimicrobia bacterium]|nr:hypothetical protein [Elusimicrobiota bacterium]
MTIVVSLYGRLRDAGHGDRLKVSLPSEATAKDALSALKSAFGPKASLLTGCVLATDDAVLAPSDPLPKRGPLAALPPVCGG